MTSAAPPPPERPSYEETVRAATGAVVAAIVELLRALREEVQRMQDGAEAFIGRVKGALVRSLRELKKALMATLLALVLVILGLVVLSIFLVSLLNHLLGEPWGTGAAAGILLALALVFWLRARAHFRAMEREAAALAARRP